MSGSGSLTPDRWRRVNDIFHRALEQPAADRRAFVEAECAEDLALASEVSSLLAAHEHAAEFIEVPAAIEPPPVTAAEPALADGQIDHPSRIFLVDANGRVREIYNLNFLRPRWVADDVDMLLNEAKVK